MVFFSNQADSWCAHKRERGSCEKNGAGTIISAAQGTRCLILLQALQTDLKVLNKNMAIFIIIPHEKPIVLIHLKVSVLHEKEALGAMCARSAEKQPFIRFNDPLASTQLHMQWHSVFRILFKVFISRTLFPHMTFSFVTKRVGARASSSVPGIKEIRNKK